MTEHSRWVLHIDMDAFYASCEQLTRPTLKGRPVLVAGVTGRGVVAGASYEARKFGARSAMPTYRATRLVGPQAVLVTPRRKVYTTASRRVFEIIARHVDVVEQLSIDEAFMEPHELQGATPDEVRDWANTLRDQIREETGLPSSIGAGSGKQYAKIGSGLAKPDGTYIIPKAQQTDILHPLPVKELWGVGPVTGAKLTGAGIETIGDFAAMTEREVDIALGGVVGKQLWMLARGIDDRDVKPRAESKQISAEHTYPQDLTTTAEVEAAIRRAASDAHRRLLIDGRGARTATVKLKMADFHIESRSTTLPYATDDLETLVAAAFRIARYPDELGPIRLVGVGFSGLEDVMQDTLFPELDQAIIPHRVIPEETGVSDLADAPLPAFEEAAKTGWAATQDVFHPEYGHGWIQGAGHGFVTVRFETRATGPGKVKNFRADDPDLVPADPVNSLAWEEWLELQEQQGE
ncbi:DNA polymerase IV [Corynebacterium genitalium ATCC 33030]|uniref:DNA polymerase IV n=1 Tax=Corynebacterium genitalium ATCC 33030 TaxID=585529 RepID=D7WEN4_9CORY|nr:MULTISPECIES: DNA polymerase IV [Corynebacterium]EFK53611.1 ImpB/MucB/SamB family protein [Corynebacterium genitalium ATCC 33030]MCQ4617856.1 DNA polymerase IV [Corynebacterium pseudogenitalium]MCQ4624602.1 DNA polymerase IV [Corynebacterium sp. CCUG 69979]UUA88811.1 DNA polymerase IV [Corynebacterium genitalium ATCC 33030]